MNDELRQRVIQALQRGEELPNNLVVEIKGNEELRESSEENRKKNEYAVAHFGRVNEHLAQEERRAYCRLPL